MSSRNVVFHNLFVAKGLHVGAFHGSASAVKAAPAAGDYIMETKMKKLLSILCLAGMAATQAHASTATNTFNVSINLTSVCKISTVPTVAFSYTSFQEAAATFSSSFDILCTNTLPIAGITLDSTSVTDAATDLAYTLALPSNPTVGAGVAQAVTITGSMAANQAGKCATATCTNTGSANRQRTLTITY